MKFCGELKGCLTTKAYNNTKRVFVFDDANGILKREWFKVEFIGYIVVS